MRCCAGVGTTAIGAGGTTAFWICRGKAAAAAAAGWRGAAALLVGDTNSGRRGLDELNVQGSPRLPDDQAPRSPQPRFASRIARQLLPDRIQAGLTLSVSVDLPAALSHLDQEDAARLTVSYGLALED